MTVQDWLAIPSTVGLLAAACFTAVAALAARRSADASMASAAEAAKDAAAARVQRYRTALSDLLEAVNEVFVLAHPPGGTNAEIDRALSHVTARFTAAAREAEDLPSTFELVATTWEQLERRTDRELLFDAAIGELQARLLLVRGPDIPEN